MAATPTGSGYANAPIIGFNVTNGLMRDETKPKWTSGYTSATTTANSTNRTTNLLQI
jgi:hypothetical protein